MTSTASQTSTLPPTAAGVDAPSVDADEIARFSALADAWWDPNGAFRPLHKFNPTRLIFIRDRLCAHFGRDPLAPSPLSGLRLLDIGCGGGLVSEPLARLGAEMVGVDASEKNIGVARLHAVQSGLTIDYRHGAAEDLAANGETFDAVLNMEVIEHVADIGVFLHACCALVKPHGATIIATLNRTPKSFALGVVAAEYVLGWLPRGTHDWRKFVRPSELAAALRAQNFDVAELCGVSYAPLADRWRLSRDLSVNYMALSVPMADPK